MNKAIIYSLAMCLMLCIAAAVYAQAPAPAAPKPDNAQSRAHIDAAKKIAGNDPLLLGPYNFFCIPANTRANNANAPELEPVKIFDNVYAVGNSETIVYAVTTSDGIFRLYNMPRWVRSRHELSERRTYAAE